MPSFPSAGRARRIVARAATACLAALSLIAADAGAADRSVLAIVTLDGYADVKKQLGWLGAQVGQPALAVMMESALLVATQRRGLAGLDAKRPLGLVVSTDGRDLAVQGFVPVKSLDGLLASLEAVTGPVERSGDVRSLVLPSGVALDVGERDGWAVVTPRGMNVTAIDPAPLFAPLAEKYSVGIELFPHRLPEPLRLQLRMLLEQLATAAAAQGQPLDPRAVGRAIDGMADTESLVLGIAIDADRNRVFLENRTAAMPGSPTALAMQGSDRGRLTVAMPQPADGRSPAISAHLVQTVPEEARREVMQTLDLALPPDSDDPLTQTIAVLLREMISSVLATGGIDAAAVVETPAEQPGGGQGLPDVTVGVRVKDGPALEKQLARTLAGPAGARLLPEGVTMAFHTGKVDTATLHSVSVDLRGTDAAGRLGDSLELTLAVTPEYAFLLAGGDPRRRLASLLGPGGRVDPAAKPIAGIEVAVDRVMPLVGGAAAVAPAAVDAAAGGDASNGRVQLVIRPLEQGIATRITADADALRALAALAAGGAGLGLPLPDGVPVPVPAR